MHFYVVGRNDRLPKKAKYPCLRLESDDWNDFSICTLFHLSYHHSDDDQYDRIGDVKIMERGKMTTELPEDFGELDDRFCSLGQELDFYKTLKAKLPDDYRAVLENLNDAATNPGIADEFEHERIFKTSLLRFSDAEKALRQAAKLLDGIDHKEAFQFSYECQIGGAAAPHRASFDFKIEGDLPNRIIALVGKNGTGKTQYLARMAVDLSGQRQQNATAGRFQPYRPSFGKVIAVSYSAFDKFTRPKKNRSFSYRYCGLKDDKGFLSQTRMAELILESIKRIEDLDRVTHWRHFVTEIVGEEASDIVTALLDKPDPKIFDNSSLSSGQSILIFVLTELLANIRQESLILFDEPEMHLHPNATANLMRRMHRLLELYDSYGILATHSPIIIQEIPSDFVYVFEREGDHPLIRKLDIESFGENLTTITQHVFETAETKATYKQVLEKLAKDNSYEQVLKIFKGRLSFNAKMYLKARYLSSPQ